MVITIALSWSDIFSPLESAASAVLEGALNFFVYVKCLLMGEFYSTISALVLAIPTDWRSSIDSALSGSATIFKSADIFLPVLFLVNAIVFSIAFTLAFWVLKFACRIELLGFKLGG